MKRKFILLPIFLTALAPTITVVGCGKPEHEVYKVKVDSSSDTDDIFISVPEITLNSQLVIPYRIITMGKELDADASWIKFESSSQLPLTNPEFSYDDGSITISANKVTTYDITVCLKAKTWPVPSPDYVIDDEVNVGASWTIGLKTLNPFSKSGDQRINFVLYEEEWSARPILSEHPPRKFYLDTDWQGYSHDTSIKNNSIVIWIDNKVLTHGNNELDGDYYYDSTNNTICFNDSAIEMLDDYYSITLSLSSNSDFQDCRFFAVYEYPE